MKTGSVKSGAEKKPQSFLHGSLILIIATGLVKIIGAVYRIPLGNLLGSTGMGYYSTAYDLYVPMYSIAMAGLPIAISRIVSEQAAYYRNGNIKKTLKIAKRAFIVTGGTGLILMVLLAFLLTGRPFNVFNNGSLPGILAIAPCLVFCCIMSAYRGYYEGLRNMIPTAVSEVLEALGKLVFGFGIAYFILKLTGNYSYAAAGALFGISIGTAASALYLVIKYRLTSSSDLSSLGNADNTPPISDRAALRALIIVAVPIVLGSLVNNVTSLIDVAMVQRQLSVAVKKAPDIMFDKYSALIASETVNNSGYEWVKDLPNSLYGCHRGYAFSIYNLVPVLTSVLGVSAIPVLSTAWAKQDLKEVKNNVQTMIRTTALIAVPAGLGIVALSKQILELLYSDSNVIDIAAPNLRILGVCAVFAGINAPLVNMLQAIGKQVVPLRNIAVGAVLKIVINFILVGMPDVNIVGVPIGTTVCYAYICISNFICFVHYSGCMPNILSTVIKPLICGTVCAASAYLVITFGTSFVTGKILTLCALLAAVIVYVIMIAITNAIEKEDLYSLPMGTKIAKILTKLRIVR